MFDGMTLSIIIIDLVVLLIAGYAALLLISQPNEFKMIRKALGFKLLIAGLSVYAVVYFADLTTSFVIPFFTGSTTRSLAAQYTHIAASWMTTVMATVWMAAGFLLTTRAILSIAGEMEQSEKSMKKALEKQTSESVRLREVTQRAIAATRAKSKQLADVSHELRTPLNAIIGFADIMQKEPYGPLGHENYREFTKDIRKSGEHLLSLINDILDLSRIESGQLELREETVDLSDVIGSVQSVVKEQARAKGVNIEAYVPIGMPFVQGDERRIKQILLNLLSNAVKFSEDGARVTIKAWCNPASGHVVQVADTGIGMAPSDIPKALTPFGQIDSHLSKDLVGTGLGLPLSKSLAEMHGGSLNIESQLGHGTTVTVRFPSHRIVAAEEPQLALGA